MKNRSAKFSVGKAPLVACLIAMATPFSIVSAEQTLRIAGNFPVEHTASKAMEMFKAEVEQATDGDLKIDLFPAMQLGGASENVDQVSSGIVFGVITSIAYFSRIVPEYEAVSLPFLFNSREAAFRVIDGPVGELFDEQMADKGFMNLGYGELGFRNVTNSVRPIASVSDFDGLKIRLQPNEVHLDTFRALGANPVAMDIKEVYSALQQGVLDGHENPYNIIHTRRFFEVQEHLSDSGHFYDFINVAVNKAQFDALPEEHRMIIQTAMDNAMQWQRAEAEKLDLYWRDELVKSGMTLTSLSDDTRAELRKATASVIDTVKERVDPALIDQVVAAATAQ